MAKVFPGLCVCVCAIFLSVGREPVNISFSLLEVKTRQWLCGKSFRASSMPRQKLEKFPLLKKLASQPLTRCFLFNMTAVQQLLFVVANRRQDEKPQLKLQRETLAMPTVCQSTCPCNAYDVKVCVPLFLSPDRNSIFQTTFQTVHYHNFNFVLWLIELTPHIGNYPAPSAASAGRGISGLIQRVFNPI